MPSLTRPRNQPARNRELIGAYLKEKRMALGLSQAELLDRIGSEAWFTSWSAIEIGQRNLPPQSWKAVRDALGIDHDEFIQIMMRYTNPWAYELIYGSTPALKAELAMIPKHYDGVDQRRHRKARVGNAD
jgi:transcriptional regulator with XRE-family HTH domain